MSCLACKKQVEQTPGKKARLYCNDACRKAYKRTLPKADISITDTISGHDTPPPKDTELTEDTSPIDHTTVEGICLKCKRVMKHGIQVNVCFECFKPTYIKKEYLI